MHIYTFAYALAHHARTHAHLYTETLELLLQIHTNTRSHNHISWVFSNTCFIFLSSDVPLFLPLYAYGRVYDLYKIATEENTSGKKLKGQINFSSGWEWGYWLSDVITARASWQPYVGMTNAMDSLAQTLLDVLAPFGSSGAAMLQQQLVAYIKLQRALLIFGQMNSTVPARGNHFR